MRLERRQPKRVGNPLDAASRAAQVTARIPTHLLSAEDAADRRGADFQRLVSEWLAVHDHDWNWMRDYLDDAERLEVLDEIMAARAVNKTPADRDAAERDIERKWSRRSAEKYAESEMRVNDEREALSKFHQEDE